MGWTPLIWATTCSNLPLVSFLLSHGADIEAKSYKGATCEDFIISAISELGRFNWSEAGPSRHTLATPLSPHSSDRQLIADLIFEHQEAISRERAERVNKNGRQHLRRLSSNSSQGSQQHSMAPSSLLETSTSISSVGDISSQITVLSKTSNRMPRRLVGRRERTQIAEAELRARELAEGRKRALLDVAVMMQVDYSDLIGEPPIEDNADVAEKKRSKPKTRRKSDLKKHKGKAVHSGLASGCGAIEVGMDPLSMEFDFDSVRSDQMLVVGELQVARLLQHLISEARPIRAPWIARSKPANVLYLCVRYACSLPDEDLIEELFFGAVDRIEAVLYAHPTEMTYLAFWLYNCMLLLHYLQRDATLKQSQSMHEYHSLLADLINEIYVFVIRDMERRIDKVIDAAMLDHDSIPGFEDVRFEGEWNFIKTLTGSVKRANQSTTASPLQKRPLSQLFSSDTAPSLPSTPSSSSRRGAPSISIAPVTPMSLSIMDLKEVSHDASASDLLAKPLPRTITLLLTSTLHILQLYEVNPSIIVQALSQVFYWVGCELFNRVIHQRRYLCKSKAMQIRLNISALEDWVKTNALPLSIVNQHLSKLNQLVSWLLCQSSLTEFDGLIATMQGLRDLSPSQLKYAIKNYRYEVGETRINPDCLAYLDQLQADWEKRQEQELLQESGKGHSRGGTATQRHPNGRHQEEVEDEDSAPSDDLDDEQLPLDDTTISNNSQQTTKITLMSQKQEQQQQKKIDQKAKATQKAIDRLFETGQSMINYVPPASLSIERGEGKMDILLNSRDMLPFALPSQAHTLIISPGDAFGFGRGHFMGTGTPSLKSFRSEGLLGSALQNNHSRRGSLTGSSPTIGSSKASSSEASSRCSSRISQVSGTSSNNSQLYPQGKGLAAGSFWQPVPILPEETLDEIQALMKRVDQEKRFHGNSRRPSLDSRLSDAAFQSPNRSPIAMTKSPSFGQSPEGNRPFSPHDATPTVL